MGPDIKVITRPHLWTTRQPILKIHFEYSRFAYFYGGCAESPQSFV
jgi:hypothetical protein